MSNYASSIMRVQKRNGDFEEVSFDKVLKRFKTLSGDLKGINVHELTQKVCTRIFDGVKTSELDELAAHMCSSMMIDHPDYGKLASRIIVSNHHKNTSPSFSETIQILYDNTDTDGRKNPLVSEALYAVVKKNKEKLNSYIDYERDHLYDYFGFKTLERAYLMRINGRVIERPQHMWMRVALGIHGSDLKDTLATYDLMSQKYFTHATPTLFNSGTPRPQNSSCYLVAMQDDSIEGIFDTLKDCALISKYAGGIGLHIHSIRGRNSMIRGTNGQSSGIIPMLRVFNNTARYVNQAGRRNGSIALFLEPWHMDIEGFLDMRKNHGNEEERGRDLFYALWIPDLFMKRVQANGTWSLMCPDVCRGLCDTYGDAFEELYTKYEAEGKFVKQVPAQDLWFHILESQIETGTPYMLYKDAANRKSNQQNLGTIKSSNLCSEIIEYSAPDECAVCNLASICLPSFVKKDEQMKASFDFNKLHAVAKAITKNLNKVIDVNFYPIEKARRSNLKHRPIGIGVQGLADTYVKMRFPFDSEEARQLNREMFECIYHGAVEASMEIARKRHSAILRLRDDAHLAAQHKQAVKDAKATASTAGTVSALHQELVQAGMADPNETPVGSPPGPPGLMSAISTLTSGPGQGLSKKEKKDLRTYLNMNEYDQVIVDAFHAGTCHYPGAYSTFEGSPASKGQLQFDLWNVTSHSGRYDWDALKKEIQTYGMRNSLLLAPMPTASTSQIMGFNECFEPYTSNLYKRKTLAGEFIMINNYLIEDLSKLGLWNSDMKNKLILYEGSVQSIPEIPETVRNLYKTSWELKQRVLIDQAADRGAYVCQSQSMNLFVEAPDFKKLTSMHFYTWEKGLKTGMYYLRTRPRAKTQQFTIDPKLACSLKNKEACEMCSS